MAPYLDRVGELGKVEFELFLLQQHHLRCLGNGQPQALHVPRLAHELEDALVKVDQQLACKQKKQQSHPGMKQCMWDQA